MQPGTDAATGAEDDDLAHDDVRAVRDHRAGTSMTTLDADLGRRLIAAFGPAARAAVAETGIDAARAALDTLRDEAGPAVFPSLYRVDQRRLWLTAQAGYTEILDGFDLDQGILGRAARTGEVQWVPDTRGDGDFWDAQEGFVSEVTVPYRGYVLNIETTEALDVSVVEHARAFATLVIEQVHAGAEHGYGTLSSPRALAAMVALRDPEAIAEFGVRLIGQMLGLTVASLVVRRDAEAPLAVFWRRPGSGQVHPGTEEILAAVHGRGRVAAWVGSRPPGFDAWPDLDEFVVVPLRLHGAPIGGIVGAAPAIEFTAEQAETLSAIAAHTSALLERAELERRLGAALAARNDFLAAVSHELRTPLTAIVGFSDLILDGQAVDPEEVTEFVGNVRENAAHLLALIEDILDVAKAESGTLRVRRDQRVGVAPLVRDVVLYVEPQAREREVTIAVDVPAGVRAIGDEVRIRQIVVNLVSNAVKFAPGGHVDIGAVRRGDRIVVTVRDDGEGIDPQVLPTLFRPFTGRSVTDPTVGTGLGLVISRRLAEAMGGTLDLASPGPGRGAVATLTLPAG